MLTEFVIFIPSLPPHLQQSLDLFFFGKYSTAFQVAANQSAKTDLEKNDLQVGMGTADNTGSSVEFANGAVEHANGLAIINFIAKQGPEYYYYDGDTYNWTTKTGTASTVRAASANIVTYYPSSDFSGNIPYPKSGTQYMAIVKPSQNTTFQSNAIRSWSLTYNVARNDKKLQDVNIQRDGKNLGWVYSYTGTAQTLNAHEKGKYKVECWGAQGGGGNGYSGGKGGYTSGQINLSSNKNLYVYVGQQGESFDSKNVTLSTWVNFFENCGASDVIVFNNGGYAVEIRNRWNYPGGGSTDLRLSSGNWNDFNSLKSRIMVASSGGGAELYWAPQNGIDAGTITGKNGTQTQRGGGPDGSVALAGTQTAKGNDGTGRWMETNSNRGFGVVQYVQVSMGGSGNGYYCGGLGNHGDSTTGTGATGSSFISGYPGCNAISENSTENNIVHTGQPNHYSGYVFSNAVMKAGNESMPSPSGGTETGHSGNGCAIITQVSY